MLAEPHLLPDSAALVHATYHSGRTPCECRLLPAVTAARVALRQLCPLIEDGAQPIQEPPFCCAASAWPEPTWPTERRFDVGVPSVLFDDRPSQHARSGRPSPPHWTRSTLAGRPVGGHLEAWALNEADDMTFGDRIEDRLALDEVLAQKMPCRLSTVIRVELHRRHGPTLPGMPTRCEEWAVRQM
jgi:hypothetical protein